MLESSRPDLINFIFNEGLNTIFNLIDGLNYQEELREDTKSLNGNGVYNRNCVFFFCYLVDVFNFRVVTMGCI